MSDDVPTPKVLLLPGWQDAGPAHWLSRWQATHGYGRVAQHDWQRPLRGDWLMQLEEAVLTTEATASSGLTLVADGLGCLLVTAWAAHSRHSHRVKAALLVAPLDAEREALRPLLASWSPICWQPLPFTSILVGRRDDPCCSFDRAQAFAHAWGAEFIDGGQRGQINAESGLSDWPQGQAFLQLLEDRAQALAREEADKSRAGPMVCEAQH